MKSFIVSALLLMSTAASATSLPPKAYCEDQQVRTRIQIFSEKKAFGIADRKENNLDKCKSKGYSCTTEYGHQAVRTKGDQIKELWDMCRGMRLSHFECFEVIQEARRESKDVPDRETYTTNGVVGYKADRKRVAAFLAANPQACEMSLTCSQMNNGAGLIENEIQLLGCN